MFLAVGGDVSFFFLLPVALAVNDSRQYRSKTKFMEGNAVESRNQRGQDQPDEGEG